MGVFLSGIDPPAHYITMCDDDFGDMSGKRSVGVLVEMQEVRLDLLDQSVKPLKRLFNVIDRLLHPFQAIRGWKVGEALEALHPLHLFWSWVTAEADQSHTMTAAQ
jgi:hypothetical protein